MLQLILLLYYYGMRCVVWMAGHRVAQSCKYIVDPAPPSGCSSAAAVCHRMLTDLPITCCRHSLSTLALFQTCRHRSVLRTCCVYGTSGCRLTIPPLLRVLSSPPVPSLAILHARTHSCVPILPHRVRCLPHCQNGASTFTQHKCLAQ